MCHLELNFHCISLKCKTTFAICTPSRLCNHLYSLSWLSKKLLIFRFCPFFHINYICLFYPQILQPLSSLCSPLRLCSKELREAEVKPLLKYIRLCIHPPSIHPIYPFIYQIFIKCLLCVEHFAWFVGADQRKPSYCFYSSKGIQIRRQFAAEEGLGER